MSKKLFVFSSEDCGNCKPYKHFLNTLGIDFEEVDTDTDAGAVMAAQHNVRGLPTSLIMEGDEVVFIQTGTGAIDRVRKEFGK